MTGHTTCPFAMQFCGFMAIHAVHARFAEVNIPLDTLVLTHIFVAHSAAMASRTRARHGWGALEQVTVEQATAGRDGRADMAIATSCMTARAVIVESSMESLMVLGHTAGIHGGKVTLLSVV